MFPKFISKLWQKSAEKQSHPINEEEEFSDLLGADTVGLLLEVSINNEGIEARISVDEGYESTSMAIYTLVSNSNDILQKSILNALIELRMQRPDLADEIKMAVALIQEQKAESETEPLVCPTEVFQQEE